MSEEQGHGVEGTDGVQTIRVVVKSGAVLPDLVGVTWVDEVDGKRRVRGGTLRRAVLEEHGRAWTVMAIMQHAAETLEVVQMIILSDRLVPPDEVYAWWETDACVDNFPGFLAAGGDDAWAAQDDEEVASE